jgi:protein-tyrosine-phosphatase
MDDQPTCGKGLAEHSALPAKLGELMAATAENLEAHQRTLDLSDENSRNELDAYVRLAKEHRSLAAQLQSTAQRMAAYRDLPMGRHNERALADPRLVEAFAQFVKVERELLAQLQRAVERDQQMLAAFSGEDRAS